MSAEPQAELHIFGAASRTAAGSASLQPSRTDKSKMLHQQEMKNLLREKLLKERLLNKRGMGKRKSEDDTEI
jgi:hypothetical protein